MVHVLSGESLSAQNVAVNGLTIDTSSVESIDSTVQAIVDAPCDKTVVEVAVEPVMAGPDLTVDFTAAAGAVPATFWGADLQWRSKFFISEPRWRALVKHTALGLLRFPGGQERVRYDGKSSSSGTVADDTLTVTTTQSYEYRLAGDDVSRFIGLCKELGIQAQPEVNLTIDDAPMWADLVKQIVEDLAYDLKYISVGNEPDIKSPNGNWDVLGVTGSTDTARRTDALKRYTARYLEYQKAIAAVKPNLIYVFGELGAWTPDQLGPNLETVLGGLQGNQPGAISAHWYMLGNWGQSASASDYPSIDHLVAVGNGNNNIGYLRTIASTMRDTASAGGLHEPRLFIGEYGSSWSATSADQGMADRLATAIFSAEALETGKAAGIDSMLWFGVSDPGSWTTWVPSLIAMDDSTNKPTVRPQYYVYLIYKHLYGDMTVAVPDGHQADWSIYASRDATKNYLLLINRTADRSVQRVVKAVTKTGERLLRLTLQPHSVSVVSF